MEGGGIDGKKISWYPGHIAKAEKELKAYLKNVDVVIEVRDARIPLSTRHPSVPQWVGTRPLIVVIMRIDQISARALNEWKEFFKKNPAHPERPDVPVYFVDGKQGSGVHALRKDAVKYSAVVNERRERMGIQPRAARAAVIGFPNVGKSALINKLLGKNIARSQNLPGVTRALQWVRLGGSSTSTQLDEIDILDSPGIIPAKHLTQRTAMRLAICNDIGGASYDSVLAAVALCSELNRVHKERPYLVNMERLCKRFKLPFDTMEGEDIVFRIAAVQCDGCMKSAANKLLSEFRNGKMGSVSLEHVGMAKIELSAALQELDKAKKGKQNPKTAKSTGSGHVRSVEVAPSTEDDASNEGSRTAAITTGASLLGNDDEDEDTYSEEDVFLLEEDADEIIDKGKYDGW